ncbi:hypothetical protein CBR_g370 [Chara braunii]|uniref:Uncharacterized protein n=1 Tax=Chara braunii TaxID=69332 RepID=A0A388JQD1_CHABU|nr:hypothetical protein CBR_g370 [Chara braunii]|eukprot:GBG60039.1 hypothetical protein CBR_g370 [Chara braunii]
MAAMAGRRCTRTVIRSISVVLERGSGGPLPAGGISAAATRESHVSCHARAFGQLQLQSGSAGDASASPPLATAASSCSSSPRTFSTSHVPGMTAACRRVVRAHPPATWHSSSSLTQGRRQIAGWTSNRAAQELYNRHRQIVVLNDKEPDVAVDAYVAPNATLIGDVEIEDRATIWYGCVLRGDLSKVKVGFYSSIQEKSVIHSAPKSAGVSSSVASDTVIGRYVSVGAGCTLRACTIEDQVVVGDRCVVMEGAVVEKNAILEAGSVVPPGRLIGGKKLWGGNPARYVRDLTTDEIAAIPTLSVAMNTVAGEHASEFLPYSSAYLEAEALKESLAGKATAT